MTSNELYAIVSNICTDIGGSYVVLCFYDFYDFFSFYHDTKASNMMVNAQ
jgi:hypothetical protein